MENISNSVEKVRRFLSDSITDSQIIRDDDSKQSEEELFSTRLSSYSSFLWSVKPRNISPPVCASYGWIAIEKDLLECVSCKQMLCTQLPPVWQLIQYEKALSTLMTSLKEKHHKLCPWPLNNSKDNYLHDKFLNKDSCIKSFCARLKDLVAIQDSLPVISSAVELKLAISDCLMEKVSSIIDCDTSCMKRTFELAICGWQTKKVVSGTYQLFCSQCLRQTDPAFYATALSESPGATYSTGVEKQQHTDVKCVEVRSSQTEETLPQTMDDEIPVKRRKFMNLEKKEFDPLAQHQTWCPWTDSNYRVGDGSATYDEGWQVLLNILRDFQIKRVDASDTSDYESPRTTVLMTKKILKQWIISEQFL